MADYYKVLDVDKKASADEIKKAYRKLAHKYHPDKKGGDEKKFKEVNEAYQTLGDDKKRSHYDQFGSAFGQGGFPSGAQGFGGFDSSNFQGFSSGGQRVNIDMDDIFDMFGSVFGGRGFRRRDPNRGADIQISIDIELKDAARGVIRQVGLNRSHPKDDRGKKKDLFEISIPAGIGDGETLIMRGKGQEGMQGSPAGDLYITLRIRPDKRFKRVGNDLLYVQNIKLTEALLGATIKVPTLDGNENIKIPAGTQHGDLLRLRGQGIGSGSLIIQISIEMPKKINKKAKELLEELSKEL
ncbi:MAG: J domain-containing protein [Parcubacteria group bacterium]